MAAAGPSPAGNRPAKKLDHKKKRTYDVDDGSLCGSLGKGFGHVGFKAPGVRSILRRRQRHFVVAATAKKK